MAGLSGAAASQQIDDLLSGLEGDWRGTTLAEVRALIHQAVPDVVEEWKWMGSPVWSHHGILAVGNAHKQKVKLTFPQGAQLADPQHVFNNGLDGKAWRSIDLFEGDSLPTAAFIALIREAARFYADRDARTTAT